MLAQFPTPAPMELWSVLGVALFILSAIALVYRILADRKRLQDKGIKPQPLSVILEKEFVHRAEYERRDNELRNMIAEAEKEWDARDKEYRHLLRELSRDNEKRAEGIHQRINAVAEEMPRKVIELLKHTGQLRWPMMTS